MFIGCATSSPRPASSVYDVQVFGALRLDDNNRSLRSRLRAINGVGLADETLAMAGLFAGRGWVAVKSLDTFDFVAIPSLNKMLVLELARCEYILRRDNIIALGNSGTALWLHTQNRHDATLYHIPPPVCGDAPARKVNPM